ncbi:hypothetical protein BC831DRAFT_494529 [Entophlyctis helioformis]|nr:hypothetical protein BC831DRAFT_494529 [Entophlyctis helioformis]
MPALCKSHLSCPFFGRAAIRAAPMPADSLAHRLDGPAGGHAVGICSATCCDGDTPTDPCPHQQQPQSRPGDRRHHQSLCCAAMVGGIPV